MVQNSKDNFVQKSIYISIKIATYCIPFTVNLLILLLPKFYMVVEDFRNVGRW